MQLYINIKIKLKNVKMTKKNYLLGVSVICCVFLIISCSKDEMNSFLSTESYEKHNSYSTTRSFSTEEDVIAAEIQAKLDSIGIVYGKEFVLTEGTDVSKIDETFFEFIEKSLLVEESDSNRMIPISILNKDSLMDDSSINKIGVRAILPTETGFYTWESEELFKCDLLFKFTWTVGPTVRTSVSGSIVYDTNKYILSNFTYSHPIGEFSNITVYYTATIKEKFGKGYLIKTYTGLL